MFYFVVSPKEKESGTINSFFYLNVAWSVLHCFEVYKCFYSVKGWILYILSRVQHLASHSEKVHYELIWLQQNKWF